MWCVCLSNFAMPRGFPKTIKVDNRSELISKAMDKWAYEHGVELDFSRPGKPTDNAKVESFNGHFREECLNEHWFLSLEDAKGKIEAWRRYYNEDRPHVLKTGCRRPNSLSSAGMRHLRRSHRSRKFPVKTGTKTVAASLGNSSTFRTGNMPLIV